MLRAIVLENFKAFEGRRVIPIRPLTLIFGPNSAGKSSILQALLMLKQTALRVQTDDALLQTKGSFVDLGGFQNLTFGHDVNRVVEVAPIFEPFMVTSLDFCK